MNTYENNHTYDQRRDIAEIVAKVTFFFYFFFTLFGTSLPFRERIWDPSELTSSNIVNQIVFSTLFITAMLSLIPKTTQIISVIREEKFLTLFLVWCTISISWSDYSFVSFKRLFQFYTSIVVGLSFLLHAKSTKEVLKFIRPLIAIYMIVSLVSVFTIPGAVDEYGIWRGLAQQKNFLGQASLISILIWGYSFKGEKLLNKLFYSFMLIISIVLLFGSQSGTSAITFIYLILIGGLFSLDKIFEAIGIRRTISIVTIIVLFVSVVVSFIMASDLIGALFGEMGKDLTFTGRLDLWKDILKDARTHIWFGCGYQGYWVVESNTILALYQIYNWLPNQSHNGYVDILNETGIVGLVLTFSIIINYFVTIVRYKHRTYWKWFIVSAIIINMQETILFRGGILTGFMFIFAYLALFVEILRKEEITENNT